MSERADEKLVETLLKSIKAISRKHVEEKVDSYVVTIPLGVILPFCCDSNKKDTPDFSFAKCNFSLKYINKLKRDAKRTIDDLRTIEKMVEENFRVQLDAGRSAEFLVSLKLTPDDSPRANYLKIQISRFNRNVCIVVSSYLREVYPSEIQKLFPESDSAGLDYHYEKILPYHFEAKKVFSRIVKAACKVYENAVKKYEERIEFLKRPVESYDQLTEPVQSCSPDAVPRYLKYEKWERELIDTLEDIFTANANGKKVTSEVTVFEGYLLLDVRSEDDLAKKAKSISKLKKLISYFPNLENYDCDLGNLHVFCFEAFADGSLDVALPSQCYVITDHGGTYAPLVRGNVKKMSFSKWLNVLERKISERLERSEAINLTKKKQRKTKRMML